MSRLRFIGSTGGSANSIVCSSLVDYSRRRFNNGRWYGLLIVKGIVCISWVLILHNVHRDWSVFVVGLRKSNVADAVAYQEMLRHGIPVVQRKGNANSANPATKLQRSIPLRDHGFDVGLVVPGASVKVGMHGVQLIIIRIIGRQHNHGRWFSRILTIARLGSWCFSVWWNKRYIRIYLTEINLHWYITAQWWEILNKYLLYDHIS